MLDLRSRESLIASLPGGGIGAEIGVEHGHFSAHILASNAPSRLFLVDNWSCPTYPDHQKKIRQINAALEIQYTSVMKRFLTDPRVFVIHEWSFVAADFFPDEFLDWIYIDADHVDVARDLIAWVPKVKRGGWVTGHDYNMDDGQPSLVMRDVNAYIAARDLQLQLTQDPPCCSWAFQKS